MFGVESSGFKFSGFGFRVQGHLLEVFGHRAHVLGEVERVGVQHPVEQPAVLEFRTTASQ